VAGGDDYAIPPANHPYHGTYDLDTLTSPNYRDTEQGSHSIDIPASNRRTQSSSPALSLPPQTTLYFLTPETRRLEYAAIDAASRGVRGFVSKLVPGCMVGRERSRGFHTKGGDDDSDAGSVRRYRLDEGVGEGEEFEMGKEDAGSWGREERVGKGKGSGWRRFVPGLRRGRR